KWSLSLPHRSAPVPLTVQTSPATAEEPGVPGSPMSVPFQLAGSPVSAARAGRGALTTHANVPASAAMSMNLPRCIVSLSLLIEYGWGPPRCCCDAGIRTRPRERPDVKQPRSDADELTVRPGHTTPSVLCHPRSCSVAYRSSRLPLYPS